MYISMGYLTLTGYANVLISYDMIMNHVRSTLGLEDLPNESPGALKYRHNF